MYDHKKWFKTIFMVVYLCIVGVSFLVDESWVAGCFMHCLSLSSRDKVVMQMLRIVLPGADTSVSLSE